MFNKKMITLPLFGLVYALLFTHSILAQDSTDKIYQADDLFAPFASFKTASIRGKKFIWKDFLVYTNEGWSRDNTKSDDSSLVLKTGIFNREMITLNRSTFEVQKDFKDYMINEIFKSIKDDTSYQQVILHKQSHYTVLGNPNCPVITAIIHKNKKMYIFQPYRNGKLYTIIAVSGFIDKKVLPLKTQKFLANIILEGDDNLSLKQPNVVVNIDSIKIKQSKVDQDIVDMVVAPLAIVDPLDAVVMQDIEVPIKQKIMSETKKELTRILFDGVMGDKWLELAAYGGNFKKFAKIENKILIIDVPEGNGKGKTGIRSAEALVKVVEKEGKFSAKTTVDFNPKLSSNFVIALIPPDWNGNLEWRSHHIRVSLENNEDKQTSSLSLIIKGSKVMKVDVKLHSIDQLNILLQPDHLVLVMDNKENILLQGMLNKELSIPKEGYKISVLAAASKNNQAATLALKKISIEQIPYDGHKIDIYGFLTKPKKVTLFDGLLLGYRWQHYVDSQVSFGSAVTFKNHSFNVNIPEKSGEANIGIKSSKPIIWLDQFGKGAERIISFKFNPQETTGFALALSHVKNNFIVSWVKNPETKKAMIQVFVNKGLNFRRDKPDWQQELSDVAPEEVIFTLKPGEITLSGSNIPAYTHHWSLIKASSAFELYAYTSPIAFNKKVKMSLKEITLDQRILKPVDVITPLAGVKPLPIKTLFDKGDSSGWSLTPWNSKKIPAESCLLNETGFIVSSVPKGAYLAGCNIHTDKKIITLDRRLDTGAYKISAYFDPLKTKNFRLIWSPRQDRHNWSYCELSLLLSKQQQDVLVLRCSYGSNRWQRKVSSQWLKTKWNGKVNLTMGKNWIEGGLDKGPSIRMNVVPASKLYVYVNAPNWQHNKINPELLFTQLTGEWVSNEPMDATARWDFIDDEQFDATAFLKELADEVENIDDMDEIEAE